MLLWLWCRLAAAALIWPLAWELPYGAGAAYGSSQARGQIRATAAGLHHSHNNAGLSHIYNLHHSSQQCWILNPLSEARDQIHLLMDTAQIRFH